jgi:tetraacyldisaccharide 4'-kinase
LIGPLKIILYPFSCLYNGITSLRNYLYDRRIFKSTQFDIPVIGVGNLAVGGTGKTPMVEYLLKTLKNEMRPATLSRGYGRKTRGFRIVGKDDDATTIGDEPYQLHEKFKQDVIITVGEERVLAIPQLLYHHPEVQIIILDDAFQHRSLKPTLQLLLTSYSKPFYDDLLMPSGTLRESRGGAKRADVLVVTKCPADIDDSEMEQIKDKIKNYAGDKEVFFSSLSYDDPVLISGKNKVEIKDVVLVTGIANADPLIAQVRKNYTLVRHFKYADHYHFKRSDIQKFVRYIKEKAPGAIIMTTEKDAVKLKKIVEHSSFPIYALPVEMKFIKDKRVFEERVREAANYKED